jgi:chromosome segregation ATPase
MSIDERLQVLVQSTESLHASCQELHAAAARHDDQIRNNSEQIRKNSEQIDKILAALRIDAENIQRLANIATAHEQRLDNLERDNT